MLDITSNILIEAGHTRTQNTPQINVEITTGMSTNYLSSNVLSIMHLLIAGIDSYNTAEPLYTTETTPTTGSTTPTMATANETTPASVQTTQASTIDEVAALTTTTNILLGDDTSINAVPLTDKMTTTTFDGTTNNEVGQVTMKRRYQQLFSILL